MSSTLLALIFWLSGAAAALSQDALAEREARRAQCLSWLDAGYPSGLEEASCRSEFDLPSPFLIVCARGLRLGFRDVAQRSACADFFVAQSWRIGSGYVRGGAPL